MQYSKDDQVIEEEKYTQEQIEIVQKEK